MRTYFFKKRNQLLSVSTAICLFFASAANAQEIDLLLKGGHVIDAKNKINSKWMWLLKTEKFFV